MTLKLVSLQPRCQALIFLLRHPFPGLSPSERDELHAQRRERWIRDEPELTAREERILNDIQAGFEHAEPGEDDYWNRVWETRKQALLKVETGTLKGSSATQARPVSGWPTGGSANPQNTSRLGDLVTCKTEVKPAVNVKPERESNPAPSALVPPKSAASSDGLGSDAAGSKAKASVKGGSDPPEQRVIKELLFGSSWEDVKAMPIKERVALARKLMAVSSGWRASVQPFLPASISSSPSISSALSLLNTTTNAVISKPADRLLDRAALDRLGDLVRFRSTKAVSAAGETDDYESDLFKAWLKIKDSRTVERLLVASLVDLDVKSRRKSWFGPELPKSAAPTMGLARNASAGSSGGPSKRQRLDRSSSPPDPLAM